MTDSIGWALDIKVTPAQIFYGGITNDSDPPYKNESVPRGLAFIANYKDFDDVKMLKTRNGSEVDVKNFTLLFKQMGYKVNEPHLNMGKNETNKAIDEFTKKEELNNVDSCIGVFMSHGDDKGSFYTKDGHKMKIDDVVNKFNNLQCPALSGKPKILIFLNCRGHEVMRPVMVNVYKPDCPFKEEGIKPVDIKKDGTKTDIFIIHATVPGNVSFRSECTGTVLARAICKIFMQYAHDLELEVLMRKVSQFVRNERIITVDENEEVIEAKQVIERVIRGFDRPFYFNPRPLGDTFSPRREITQQLAAARKQQQQLAAARKQQALVEAVAGVGEILFGNDDEHRQVAGLTNIFGNLIKKF